MFVCHHACAKTTTPGDGREAEDDVVQQGSRAHDQLDDAATTSFSDGAKRT